MFQKSALVALLASTAFGALTKRYTFPLPESQGSETFDEPYEVAAGETFDGGMKTYGRGVECTGQDEGGEDDTVFIVQEGGTLKNAIIGTDQIEGVYCLGSCTIENVWWEKVCEDALSLKEGDGTFNIIGGGAQGAEDKVIQHNTGGEVVIDGFEAYDFGKLYRSCGTCGDVQRSVSVSNVIAVSGSQLVGINENFGDSATIDSSVCATDVDDICATYNGTDGDEEPEEVSTGPSDYCIYTEPIAECE
ncbi:putative pectate lyase G [Aspergillus ambiguus]|uniref:pectate lyase n=1 Tax=Aspergillus ambiguus TaxID=176160 RepID=UPI003CCD90A4